MPRYYNKRRGKPAKGSYGVKGKGKFKYASKYAYKYPPGSKEASATGFVSGVVSVAKRALRAAAYASKLLNVEFKHKDLPLNFNIPVDGTGWGITYVSGVAQGDDSTNRSGLTIRMVSVYLTGHVYLDSTTQQGSAVVRIAIIRDKASNGVIPATADIFVDNRPTSLLNTVYAGTRFEVILSTKFTLEFGNVAGHVLDEFKNIKDGNAEYKGATANQADAATGHLYLLYVWEDVGTIAPDTVPILGNVRITYVDN